MSTKKRTSRSRNRPRVLLLTDYRGHFYSATTHPLWTMRIERIATALRDGGCDVRVAGFSEIDIRSDDVSGMYVVYTSQEDAHLFYKGYIENVILALQLRGAILLPRFELFRAHHDKVFMEFLRDVSLPKAFQTISTRAFGTLEEAERAAPAFSYPVVVKPAAGAMSTGVELARTPGEFLRHARSISLTATPFERLKQAVKRLIRNPEEIKSIHRQGFIAQTFIPGLVGDYKVIVYGDRTYVLRRENRENDFRASGSGKFHFDGEVAPGLLDFTQGLVTAIQCPWGSFDIGYDGARYHLLEMQFLMFGNVTVERSVRHFRRKGARWQEVREGSNLEQVFAESVLLAIQRHPARRRT